MKKLVISLLIASSILSAHQSALGMDQRPNQTPAPSGTQRMRVRGLKQELVQAAKNRNWTKVMELIENPIIEIDFKDIEKNTALIYAVRAQNIEQNIAIVDLLLVYRANPMHTNNAGESAYSLALASNNPELIARFAPDLQEQEPQSAGHTQNGLDCFKNIPPEQLPIQSTSDPIMRTGCETETLDYLTENPYPEYSHASEMQIEPSQEATISTDFSEFKQYMSTHHPEININNSHQLIKFAKDTLHGNHELAIMALEYCALKGDSNAMIRLGIFYRNGIPRIMPPNPELAIKWFTKAVKERGNSNAMVHLGILHRDGIPKIMLPDIDKAVEFFTQAAEERGDINAMMHLGILYRNGIPKIIDPNPKLATKWLTQAARKGDPVAKTHLEDINAQNECVAKTTLFEELPPGTRWADVSDSDEE